MNIQEFADEIGCSYVITRAVAFDPVRLVRVWDMPVVWAWNLKNSAGRAGACGVKLHPGLQKATRQELQDTFLHEVAHCMDWLVNGRTGHGQGWWEAMIRLGEKPWITRYHNIAACKTKVQLSAEDIGL